MNCTPIKKLQPGFVVVSAVGLATSVNYHCVCTWSARGEPNCIQTVKVGVHRRRRGLQRFHFIE